MTAPTLHELNTHFFDSLLPKARDEKPAEPAPKARAKNKPADEAPATTDTTG